MNPEQYVNDANKILNSCNFNREEKYEQASELFNKAAVQYKMNKNFQEAAKYFVKAANYSTDKNRFYIQAAKCYKLDNDISEATNYYEIACQNYRTEGCSRNIAKIYKELAEMYEKVDFSTAISYYENASEMFRLEESKSSDHTCVLKVAELSAEHEMWTKAMEMYQKIAEESVDNSLTSWAATSYLYKACLCRLASNFTELSKYITICKDIQPRFEHSMECKFLEELADVKDSESFSNVVGKFDDIKKLDGWAVTALLRTKNSIGQFSEIEEDLVDFR